MILKHEGDVAEAGYGDGDELMHGAVVNARTVSGKPPKAPKAAQSDPEAASLPAPSGFEHGRSRAQRREASGLWI